MPIGGRFPRPVLRFKEGTSIYPFEGLSIGLKPVKEKKRIKLGVLYNHKLRRETEKFLDNLINGYKNFQGMQKLFNTEIELEKIGFKDLNEARDKGVPSLLSTDTIVATIPDNILRYEDEDYYVPLKQDISLLGIPSQMVRYSTIKWKSENIYVLFNLAINIYSKAGGMPWSLDENLSSEAVIGIDVYANFLSVTLFQNPKTPSITWSYTLNPHVEIAPSIKEPVLDLLEKAYNTKNKPLSSIILHRDGVAHWSEIDAIREALQEAKKIGYVEKDLFYSVLEIRKRTVPRLVRFANKRMYNPEKGVYTWIQKEAVLLVTTGYPERPLPEYTGLIRPILVTRVDTSDWEKELLTQVRDVYWLSQLHWGSAFTTPRIPITTLYAHKICRFLSIGVYPPEEYQHRLWFL